MTSRSGEQHDGQKRAPLVRAHVVEAPNGGLIIGIEAFDDERHRGGSLRITPSALAALPGEIIGALARFNFEQRRVA